ncbi:uncharacterized protein MEPE_05010 [Melanopsichium pennsylvanicum]|uniref:Uncharacterized protein n=2 Tax=Melanopsichium pennsylvanicum TaxID=63383 RepID=A0AAJ4XQW9_9BASI|nr:conserved hypothetical protein [Melanopsichium pennsylvanicum 4]SNX86301.1 uncharacterized protein MEPE_05010 [Melanopsichium pennsylvanicum]
MSNASATGPHAWSVFAHNSSLISISSWLASDFLSSRKAIPLYILLGIILLQRLPSLLERLFTPSATTSTSSFVVPAITRHARFLPTQSQHKFQYNTLYLALRLDKLETRKLDTGHAFAWKGPALVSEFVDEGDLASKRGVTPVTVGVQAGCKDDWKAKMRAAERIERRRLEEKRARNDRYTWSLTALHPKAYLRTHLALSEDSTQMVSLTNDRAKWITGSILLKLAYELRERHFLSVGPQDADFTGKHWRAELGHVWTVTMPSIAGITGINPLTVHYCFRPHDYDKLNRDKIGFKQVEEQEKSGTFWLVVLEVHNTFSERHIYVLEAGKGEDAMEDKRTGYGHQWTFPRSFHVSPFNDRGGFYRLFLRNPFTSRSDSFDLGIKLLLLVEADDDLQSSSSSLSEVKRKPKLVKKLMATLDSISPQAVKAGSSSSLSAYTGRCVRPLSPATLYAAILRQPWDLFLTFARILWEAGKLHFRKRLDAFGRPEMVQPGETPATSSTFDGHGLPPPLNKIQPHRHASANVSAGSESGDGASGGLVYPEAGWAELVAKRYVEDMVKRRMKELEELQEAETWWSVRVQSTDPADPGLYVESKVDGQQQRNKKQLVLYTRSYGVYTDLMAFRPPQLAFLVGSLTARRWGVSSKVDFDTFFGNSPCLGDVRGVCRRQFEFLLGNQDEKKAHELLQKFGVAVASAEKEDGRDARVKEGWRVNTALWLGFVAAVAEKKIFGWLGARYVKGTEPWLELQRGLKYIEDLEDKEKVNNGEAS